MRKKTGRTVFLAALALVVIACAVFGAICFKNKGSTPTIDIEPINSKNTDYDVYS